MGLLDDAIREHLDLKRRRGADPAEVERAEREALGPVRRNREVEPGEERGPALADDDDDGGVAVDLTERLEPDETPSSVPVGSSEDPEAGSDDFQYLTDDEAPLLDEADAPPTRLMRSAELPAAGDMTAEYNVEHALAQDADSIAEDGDEDVLEETPEFLQDTPDHDRLWFEQRPPRDFDFDG